MKKLIQFVAVLAVILVAVGFYRGWFTLTGDREAADQNIEVKLSVDTDKVKEDAEKVGDNFQSSDSNEKE